MIDKLICKYLGISHKISAPESVRFLGHQIFISSAEPHKRHLCTTSWEHFEEIDFSNTSEQDKEKIGLALGKTLANQLIVSFTAINIQKDDKECKVTD